MRVKPSDKVDRDARYYDHGITYTFTDLSLYLYLSLSTS